jgi:hypothetical protein
MEELEMSKPFKEPNVIYVGRKPPMNGKSNPGFFQARNAMSPGAFFFLVGYMKTYMLLVFWGFLEIFAIVGVHRLKIRKKPRLARAVVFFLTAIGVSAVLLDSLNISF